MDFLTSLAVICLCALWLGSVCAKIKLPPLLGMLIIGIVLGPYVLDLIAPSILAISPDLRQLALIIILTRAGLNLNLKDLKKNGLSAILLCFVPASVEICAYILFGTLLLYLNIIDAAVLGCVMAAVSPAVVVPRMLKLKENGYGTNKGIPDMIMAGASADDVFVIVLFTAFTAMASGGTFSFNIVWQIPVSIALGIGVGVGVGVFFVLFIKKVHIRDSIKVILILSLAFLFIALENAIETVPYSGLLSVIAFGAVVFAKHTVCAERLSQMDISGDIAVCPCRCGSQHLLCVAKRGDDYLRDLTCVAFPNGGRLSLRNQIQIASKRAIVLYDRLYAQSDGASGNRRCSSCHGVCLRTDDFNGGCARHFDNRSARGFPD